MDVNYKRHQRPDRLSGRLFATIYSPDLSQYRDKFHDRKYLGHENLPRRRDCDSAELNNDGVIDFLDLEFVAKNHRKTGPSVWEVLMPSIDSYTGRTRLCALLMEYP
jgi:hypothetical protein